MLFKFDKKSTGYILPKDTPNTTGGAHGGRVGAVGVRDQEVPGQTQPLILLTIKEDCRGHFGLEF